jgi:hypothetical protein
VEQFVKQDPCQFLAPQFRVQDDTPLAQKASRMNGVPGLRLPAENATTIDAQVRLEVDRNRPANKRAGNAG